MIIHDVVQGSSEWLALRAEHNTASEAPAMMGASKYQSRDDLLLAKKTGITPEISSFTQKLFDQGHAAEALARPMAEEIIGSDLYPVTGTLGDLLASMDGMTLARVVLFEHKMWNEALAAAVRAGELEPSHYWQLEQQLYVSKAVKVLFMVSDGTAEKREWMWYTPVAGRAEQLLAGWEQFNKDLIDFLPTVKAIAATGNAPDTLPALRIEVTGMVTASNLDQFKLNAMAVIESIKTDLQTDQDFADAEKTVKWCKDVEDRLALAKQAALSQTATIDDLFRAIDEISESTRQTRLKLDKSVKTRKEELKLERVQAAADAFNQHMDSLNKEVGIIVRTNRIDFGGAIKGMRSLESIDDKVSSTLANAKAESNLLAKSLMGNLRVIDELAKGSEHLCRDRAELAYKDKADIEAIIAGRIAEAQAAIDRAQAMQEESSQIPGPAPEPVRQIEQPASTATIKLGDINALIAPLSISADGLAQLGFAPVGTDRSAKLYRESDFKRICAALSHHLREASTQQVAA